MTNCEICKSPFKKKIHNQKNCGSVACLKVRDGWHAAKLHAKTIFTFDDGEEFSIDKHDPLEYSMLYDLMLEKCPILTT